MALLGDFLEKFKKLHGDRLQSRQSVLDVVNQVLGVQLQQTDITIKNNTLTIKASPTLKTEIYMKKEALLQALLSHKITNIR